MFIVGNPALRAIPEALVFTLIGAAWMLLFEFSIETNFPAMFPVSTFAFSLFATVTIITLLLNHRDQRDRFESELQVKYGAAQLVSVDGAKERLARNTANSRAGDALALYVLYVHIGTLPWALWGYYRWISLVVQFFYALGLIGLYKASCDFRRKAAAP